MRLLLTLGLLLATAATAQAGDGHVKSRARGKGPDVAAALASGDAARICRAAIELVGAREAARAALLLPRCPDASTAGAELAAAARKARIAVRKTADAEGWSPVEIVVRAADATVTIEPFADIPVLPGAVLLPPGTYRIVARTGAGATAQDLTVAEGRRALVMLEPPVAPPATAPGVVDFGKDEPLPPPVAGPPPKVKHESLIPERYRKGLCARKPCAR